MSTTIEQSDWPLGDLESEVIGLKATIGILGHLIQSPFQVEKSEWCNVEDQLNAYADRIKALWQQAWDQRETEEQEHEAKIAALKAEAAAADGPLSGARLERLEAMKGMLRGMAKVIINTLDGKSVSILKGLIEGAAKCEPEPEPSPPERMRW